MSRRVIGFSICALLAILAVMVVSHSNTGGSARSFSGQTLPIETPTYVVPAEQSAFIETVVKAQQASAQSENDMQRGGVRADREAELCRVVPDGVAKQWIGRVETIDSNSDGAGVLAIKLADSVTIKTWNNSVSDFEDGTLLRPHSAVFDTVSRMKVGDIVEFTGRFIRDDSEGGCFREASLTLAGKLDDPEFIFRFSDIAPAIATSNTGRTVVKPSAVTVLEPQSREAPVLKPVPEPSTQPPSPENVDRNLAATPVAAPVSSGIQYNGIAQGWEASPNAIACADAASVLDQYQRIQMQGRFARLEPGCILIRPGTSVHFEKIGDETGITVLMPDGRSFTGRTMRYMVAAN